MHSFLSKVFGRKEKDTETSPTTLRPGELLDGKFEAISPNVSPSAGNFLELDPQTGGENGKDKDKDKDARFSLFKSKSRPSPPEITYKTPIPLPQLSLNFAATNGEPSSRTLESFLSVDPDAHILLSDAIIGRRRLNPFEALVLIRACSQAIVARGLETLGVMHPHWYSASPDIQRRLLSQFIHSMEPKTPLTAISLTPALATSPFESEINFTRSPHDVAAVLRWGLRHLQLESDSFGTDDGWYKAFLDAEAAAEYPPKAFSEKLVPALPKAHLDLLTATLEIFSSLAAHSEANSTSGSKLSKTFGLWLLTSRRVEDKDNWKSFYARWERMGRMLEHLFLSRIRDESTDQRMPVRLLELVRRYPYTHGLSPPTTDLQFLSPPHFTTRRYDALYVRIEVELSSERRKPKLKVHPLNILADAFSTKVEGGEYAELWAKITAASKTGTNPSPLSNIFADETIRFLSIVPDKGADKAQEAKSPVFSLLSPSSARPHSASLGETDRPAPSPSRGHSFSVGEQSRPSSARHQHSKSATEPLPPASATSQIGSDWAQFSSSGFLDSTPAIAPLVSTLFDTDLEKTTPVTTTLSRKSSKRGKAVSRKSVDFASEPAPPVSPPPAEPVKKEATAIVRATQLEVIELDEAFIDFWSDSLLDPITASWPTFIICKFKSTLVPHLLYGRIEEGQKQKTLTWLVLEQAFTVRPAPPPSPSSVPLPDSARPVSPALSTSGRNRFSFWSMSRTASSSSQTSQKGKKKEKALNVGEMGELLEEDATEQAKEDVVKLKAAPSKSRKSKAEKSIEPVAGPVDTPIAQEVAKVAVAKAQTPVANVQVPIAQPQLAVAESKVPTVGVQTPAAKAQVPVAEAKVSVPEAQAHVAEAEAPIPEAQPPIAEVHSVVAEAEVPIAEAQAPVSEAPVPHPEAPTPEASVPEAQTSAVETLQVTEPEAPVVAVQVPVAATEQPVAEAQQPSVEAQEPTTEGLTPSSEVQDPVLEEALPAVEIQEHGAQAQTPVGEAQASVAEHPVSVAEDQASVAEHSVPVAEVPSAPSETATAGAELPPPVAEEPTPVADVPAPVVEAEAPPAEVQAAGPEAHSLDADMQPSVAESAPRADEATVQAAGVQAPAVEESPAAADVHVADVRPRTLLAEVQHPVTDEVAPVEATEGPPETPSIAEEIKSSVREASKAQVSTLKAAIAEAQSAPIVERAVTPQVGIESSETISEANPLEPESWDTVDEYPSAAQTDLKASEEDSSTRTESEEVNDLPAETSVAQEVVDISQHPEEAPAPVDESNTKDEEILDNLSSEILEESSFEVIASVPTVEKETAQPAESGEFLSSAEESGALLAIPPAATEIESPSADESLTVSVERAIEQEDTPSDAAVLETIVTPEDEEKQESISDIDFAEVVQPKAEDVLPVDEVIHDTEVALQIETAQVAPTDPETPIDAGTHGLSDAAALAEELEVNNTDESAAPTSVVEATSDEIHEGHPEPTEQVPADVEGAPERSVTESLPSPDGLAGPINIVSSVPVIEPLGVPEQSPADALVDLPAIPLVDADPTPIVPSGLTHITIPIENVSSEELTTVQEASSSNDEELPDSYLIHEATILSGSTPAPHVALSLADPISEDTALLAKDAIEDVDPSVSTGLEGEADESGNAPIKENTVSDIIVDEKTSAVIADSASGEIDRIPQDVDAVVDEAPLAVSAVQETIIEDSTSDNANPAVSLNAEASIVDSIDSNVDKVPPTEELPSEDASGPKPAVVEPQSVVELATETPLTEGTPATSDLIAQSTSGAEDSLPEAVPAVAEPVSEVLSNLPESLREHIVQMSEGKELSIQGPVVEQSIPQESAAEESLAEEAPAELIAEHSVIEESPDLENHTQDDVPATQEPFAHRVIGEQHATEILLPEPVSESTAIVSAEREITPEDPLEHVLPGSVEHVGEDDTGILEGIAAKAPSESEVAYHIPPETTSNPAQVDDVHNPNVQDLLAAEQPAQGLVATESVDEEQSQYQTEDSVVKPMIVDVLSAAPIQAAVENIGVDDLGTNLEENLNAPEDSVKDLTYEHPIVEQPSDISTVDADLSESLIDEVVAEQEPVIPEQAISESVSHSTGHFDAGEGSSEIIEAPSASLTEGEAAAEDIIATNVEESTLESTNDPVDEAPISDAEKAELNPTASAESEIPAASQEPATEDTINATIVETVEPTEDSVGHDSPLDQSIDGHLSATEDVVREVTSEKDYTVNEASTKGPELHQLEESIEPASFVEILTDEVEPSASVVAEEPNDRVDTSSIGVQEASSDSTVAETAQSKRPSEESSVVVKGPAPILATEETISAKDTSEEPATISIADDIDTSEPTSHWLELEQPVTDSAVEEVPMTTNALDATVPKDLGTDLPPPTKEPITSNYEDVETTTTSEAVEGTEDSSGTAELELPSELSPVEPAELTTIVEVDGVDAPSTESEPRPIEETPNVEPSTSTADNLSEQVNGGMLDKSPDKDDVVVIEPIPNDISEEEAGTNDGLPAKDATIEYAQNLIEPASHSEELVFLPVENTSESDPANNSSTSVSDETDLTTIKLPESHLNQSSGTTKVLIASSNPGPEPADISTSPADTPDEIHHVLDQLTLSEDPIGAEGLTEEQATKDEARDVTIADELIADQSEGISPLVVEEPTISVDEIKVSAPVPIHGHTIELASTSVEEEESVAEPATTTPGSAENNLKEDVIPASSEPAAQSSPEDALVAVSVHDPIAGAYSLDEDIAPATSEPALDSAQNSAVEVPVAPVENTVPEESEPTIVQPTSSNPVEDLSTEETVTHIPAINLPSEESTIEPIEPVSPQAQDIETVGVAPVHELETAPSATEVAVEESIPSTVKEVSEEVKLAPNTEQTTPATDTLPELSTVEEPDEEAKTTLDTQIIRTVDVTPARPEPELEPPSVPVIGSEDSDPSAIDISPQFEQAELVTKADIESSPAPLTDEAIKPSADIEQGSLTSVEPAISAPQPVVEEFASSAIEAPAETATEVEQDTAVEVVPENPEAEPSAPEVAINESIPLVDEAAKAPSDNEQATPGTFASESAPSPLEPVTEEFASLSVYEPVETATKIEPDTAVEVLPTTSEPTLEPPVPEAAIEESIPSAEEPVNAASDVEQTLTTDVEPQTFASESSPSTLELAAEEFVSSVIEEPAGTVTEVEPQTAEPELEPSAPEATVEESIPLVEETGNTLSEIQQATPEIATFESAPSAIEATPEFVSPTVAKSIQAGTEIEVVPTTSEPALEPSMLEAAVEEITPSVQEPSKAAFDSEKHLITDVVPETSTVEVTTGVDVVPATPEPASEPLEPSLPQKESALVSESAPSLTEDPVKATLNAEQAPPSDVMTSEPALEPSGLEATVVESDSYLVAELASSTVEESTNTTSAAATSTSRPAPEHFASGNSTENPTPAAVEELAPSATEESASTTSDVEQVEQVPSTSEVAPFIPEPTPETTAEEPAPAEIEELTPSTVEEPTLPTSDAAPSSSESALEFGAQETIEEPGSVVIEELPLSAIEVLISTTPHISSASDAVLSSSEPAFESFVSENTTEEPALSVAEGPDDEISDAKDLTPEPESERSVLETTEEPASAAIEQLVPSVIQESVSATSDIEQVPSVSDTTAPSSEPTLEPSVLETTAEEPAPIAIEKSESSAIEEIANITSDVPPFSDAAPSSSEPALEYTELETTTEESAPAAIDGHVPSVIEEPVSATADAEQIPSASDSAPSNSEPALKPSSLETNNQEPAALAIEGLTLSTAEEPAIATSDATPSSSEPVLEDSALQATTEELSPAPIEELAPSVIQEPVSTTTDVEHVPSASDIEPSSSEPALEPSAVEATTEEYDLAAIEEPVGATPDAEEVPPASDAAPSSSEPASEPSPLEHTSEEPAPAAIEELARSSVEEPVITPSDATPSSSEPAFEDSALETATEELDSAVIADLAVPVIEEPISVTTDVEHVPSTSDIADPALEHSALEATTEGHAPAAVDEPDPSAIEEPVGATSDTGEVPSASEIGPSSSEPALEPSAPEHTSEEPALASIEELAISSVEEPVNAASEDKPPSSEEPSAPEAVIEEPVPAPVEVPTETVNAIAEETVSVQDLAFAEDIPITIETVAAEESALFDEDDTLDAAAAEEFDDLISPITDGSAMDPDASFATSGPFALESVASSIGEDDEDLVLDVDTKVSEAEDDALNGSGNGHHSKLDTEISDLVDDGIDSPLAEAFDSADVADEAGNGHVHVDAQPSIVEVPSGGSTEPGTALAVLDASGEQHIEQFDLSGQDEPKEAHVDVAETTDSKTALPSATEA